MAMFDRKHFFLLLFITSNLFAQTPYPDYIGAGHYQGISVKTSSDLISQDWPVAATGYKTIDGKGLEGRAAEVCRFLDHATFGASLQEIWSLQDKNFKTWIDEQIAVKRSDYTATTDSIYHYLYDYYLSQGKDSNELSGEPQWTEFRYAWWRIMQEGKDQLRLRMAYALSQIFVISDNSELGGSGFALSSYYDLLSQNAFGNFKDLLKSIALHPSMGFYLSHLNNPKEVPEENTHPDQNFAREIMQLFSIGLYQLNIDGTRKKDNLGKDIPTYTNSDIAELAKVFTGLGISASVDTTYDLYFGRGIYGSDMTKPMKMYEEWHEPGPKRLPNGNIIPAGQAGMKDIDDAINFLYNHPNTGPFICRQLIQRFTSSNPSKQYITRVVQVFNNDGKGTRGNLAAVIKAILLDDEARDCPSISDPYGGKLLEPMLRYTKFVRAIGIKPENEVAFNNGYRAQSRLFQHPLSSPNVFNFYLPDYKPIGPLSNIGLVAPEFQIFNSLSAIDYPNIVHEWVYWDNVFDNWSGPDFNGYPQLTKLLGAATNDETLINEIDLLFTHGEMSQESRKLIMDSLKKTSHSAHGLVDRISLALYLALISPDFVIKK